MSQIEWKEVLLKDVLADKGYIRGPFGSALKRGDMKTSGVAVYEQQHAIYNSREFRFYIDDEKFEEMRRFQVQENDLLISCSGTVGKVTIISSADPKGIISQALLILRVNKEIIHPKYLQYFFSSAEGYNSIIARSSGSVQVNIAKRETIEQIPLHLPALEKQQEMVDILSSLDDKIKLNNKINDNLEKQAQALFKNWFIDYAPFGGQMPSDWKEGKLSDLCCFQEGYVNPSQTCNEYFDGEVKWLRAVDINESFIIDTSRKLTQKGFESAGKSALLFKPNTIVISKSGTIGRLGIISDYMCGNRAVINIEPQNEEHLPFIHQYLKLRQMEFPDLAVGSVQKNLYVSILEGLDIVIPSKKTLNSFAEVLNPIYFQMKILCEENQRLTTLRDTLLPKLMSGEMNVENIQI